MYNTWLRWDKYLISLHTRFTEQLLWTVTVNKPPAVNHIWCFLLTLYFPRILFSFFKTVLPFPFIYMLTSVIYYVQTANLKDVLEAYQVRQLSLVGVSSVYSCQFHSWQNAASSLAASSPVVCLVCQHEDHLYQREMSLFNTHQFALMCTHDLQCLLWRSWLGCI